MANPHIEMVNPEALVPNRKNPREHPKLHVTRILNSIKAYGFNNPILIRGKDNTIVAGHGRRLAAIELGLKEVPCIRLDHLTEGEALAYLLADNKTQEGAITDTEQEAAAILELFQAGLDLGPTGFSQTEIDNALLLAAAEKEGEDEDPPVVKPVCNKGDLWILGQHRLLCADSADEEALDLLMEGQKAALYATDPPYGVGYDGTAHPQNSRDKERGRELGSQNRDWGDEYWDHYESPEAFKDFLSAIFRNAARCVAEDAAWYCWHASSTTEQFLQAWRETGIRYHQTIMWVKPTHVLGFTMWNYRTEPCLMGWRQGHKPRVNAVSDEHSNCWEVDWEGKKKSTEGIHPTQKPVRLFELPMLKHTARNDICLETFAGSGSQVIAAEKLGRRCFAVERMPEFCDRIIARWEAFTGRKAERVEG